MKFPMSLPAAAAIAAASLLWPTREAHATLAVAIEVLGPGGPVRNFSVDNDVLGGYTPAAGYVQILDADPRVGFLGVGTFEPLSGFSVEGSLQTQVIASAIGELNRLNTSSLIITNDTGGQVIANVAVSGTDFTGPAFEAFASGSITWEDADGASLTGSWWNDPANAQGAEGVSDLPGSLVHSWLATAEGPADADSTSSGSVPVNDPSAFSMSIGLSLTTTDSNATANDGVFARAVNNGETLLKPLAVPEPNSLVLCLTGLMGWSARRRLRREQLRVRGSLLHLG